MLFLRKNKEKCLKQRTLRTQPLAARQTACALLWGARPPSICPQNGAKKGVLREKIIRNVGATIGRPSKNFRREPNLEWRCLSKNVQKTLHSISRIYAHTRQSPTKTALLHRFCGKTTLQFVYMWLLLRKRGKTVKNCHVLHYAYACARIDNEEFGKMHKKIVQKFRLMCEYYIPPSNKAQNVVFSTENST